MDLLHAPLDAVLGSAARVRLLRSLAPLGHPVSGRQAARIARVPAKTGQRALDDLVALGMVIRRETGGPHLYTINREHRLWPGIEALFELEEERAREVRSRFAEALNRVLPDGSGSGVVSAAIFGSVAQGDAEAGSDLDLLVLTADEASADRARMTLAELAPEFETRFGLPLSPVVMTEMRFRERAATGDPLPWAVADHCVPVLGRKVTEVLRGEARSP